MAQHVTPPAPEYTPQQVFERVDEFGREDGILDFVPSEQALRKGIEVGRRLFFAPRTRDVVARMLSVAGSRTDALDGPPPAIDLGQVPSDPAIYAKLADYEHYGQFSVKIDYSMSAYACVRSTEPTIIRLRGDLGMVRDTPPSVSDGFYHRKGIRDKRPVFHGESGWLCEQEALGGRVHAAIYQPGDRHRVFEDQIRYLYVQTMVPVQQWQILPIEIVEDLVLARPGWTARLPLTTMACQTYPGYNPTHRLRDDHSSASESSTPSPVIATPPLKAYKRDDTSSPITCGYRGTAGEDEDVQLILIDDHGAVQSKPI
ncbi:hypothetical protein IAT40_000353 [Kwoniella sp. CBS 6097]